MKKFFTVLAAVVAMSANAQVFGDEVQMQNTGRYQHSMSYSHSVCVYKPSFGGSGSIRIIVDSHFCPMFITYNISSNTWRE